MKLQQLIDLADFIKQVFVDCNFEFVDSYGNTVSVENINMYHINGETECVLMRIRMESTMQ